MVSPVRTRSLVVGSRLFLCLASLVVLALCLSPSLTAVEAASGDAQIPDGFDHEPVIMTKEKLASLKAPKVTAPTTSEPAAPVPAAVAGGGVAPATLESVPLSPTVPSDGRYTPRHSFLAPFTSKLVPHWEIGAGATVEDNLIRLTPAKQSRTGYAWNSVQVEMSDWEVLLEFKVTGRKDFGGDGFAVWFVERPEILGSVYGSTDYWQGLAVIFDTFNNDAQGKSPLISAVFNDGTLKYDASSDGQSQALDSCHFDFRNQAVPTMARLKYLNHALSLEIALRRDATGQPIWANCFHQDGIELGVDKYFGVTAHTGDVADAHELLRFEVRDLSPPSVDLDALRNKYAAEVAHQHLEHEHNHVLTSEEFQHSVLTLLSQIQGEVNMLEQGQLEIQEWVQQLRDDSFIRQSHTAALQAAAAEAAAAGTAAGGAATSATLDAASVARLATLSDAQQQVIAELTALKSAVTALPSQVGRNGASTPGRGGAGGGGGGLGASSSEIVASMRDLLTPLLAPLVSESLLKKHLDESRQVQSKALQAHATKVDDLAAALQRLQNQLTNIAQALQASGGSASSGTSAGANGGGSAFFTGSWLLNGCIVFSAGCLLLLTAHTYRESRSKDRWKLI